MEEFLDWELYNSDKGTPTVLAKVTWTAPDEKRKARWKRGFEFSLPVDFEDYDKNEGTWSLVLKVLEPASGDSLTVLMQIKFLVEAAPHHILYQGSKFVFFDGKANGEVFVP